MPAPPTQIDITGARQAWPVMTLDERRELIRLFVSTVEISRAVPGSKSFNSDRIEICWRMA